MSAFATYPFLRLTAAVLLCSYALGGEPQNQCVKSALSEEINTVLALTMEGPTGTAEARSRLAKLPADQVIAWVAESLGRESFASEEENRRRAYWILVAVNAAESEVGYNRLIVGLRDPVVSTLCMEGLEKGPKGRHAEVADRACQLLTDETTPTSSKVSILRTLIKIGGPARPCLATIEAIIADQTTDESLRHAAARAKLFVGGLKHGVGSFHDQDEVVKKAIIASMSSYLAMNTSYEMKMTSEDLETMPELLRLLIESWSSSDEDVRRSASSALAVIEGSGCYVQVRTRGDYDIAPAVKMVLVEAVNSESDQLLIDRLRKMIDSEYLDRLVEEVLRRKDRSVRQREALRGTP